MNDPYVYPGTEVLRNMLDIRDPAALAQVEAEISTFALLKLTEARIPGNYDLTHLQQFHRTLFGDLYPWAGETRTVAISKTHTFCLPQHIDGYAADIFGRLESDTFLRHRPREDFVTGLADLWSDINALHPFRDGNGRSTRAFLGQLADDAGYRVDWSHLDPERNVEASIAAFAGDNRLLREFLDHAVRPSPEAATPMPSDVEQAREAARIIVARQAEQERAAAPAPESLAERITRQLAEQQAQRATREREQQQHRQPPARDAERD